MAPELTASSMGMTSVRTATSSRSGLVDPLLDAAQELALHGGEVVEVEAQVGRVHEGAGLFHVEAQLLAQGRVEQVGGRVVGHGGGPGLGVHLEGGHVALADLSRENLATVEDEPGDGLLRVGHAELAVLGVDVPHVAHLAAALAVEGGAVEDELHLLSRKGLGDALSRLQDEEAAGALRLRGGVALEVAS